MTYSMVAFEGTSNITGEEVGCIDTVGEGDGGMTGLVVGKGCGLGVGRVTVGDVVGRLNAIRADKIWSARSVSMEVSLHLALPVFKMQSTCIDKVALSSPPRVSFNERSRIWSI